MHLLSVVIMVWLYTDVYMQSLEGTVTTNNTPVRFASANGSIVANQQTDGFESSNDTTSRQSYRENTGRCYAYAQRILRIHNRTSTQFREIYNQCQEDLLELRLASLKTRKRLSPSRRTKARKISIPLESQSNITLPYKKEYGTVTVNPHNFTFILQPESCQENNTVLVTVHSATQNHNQRMVLRNTWVNPQILGKYLPNSHRVKLVFVLGLPSDAVKQMLINYEQEMYKDLLQVDFIDSYRNNTYKAIYNMKWISSYSGCPKSVLIMKIDDDVMFNLRNFRYFWKNFTRQLRNTRNLYPEMLFMAGNLFKSEPHRSPQSKWYIPRSVYKYDTFPYWFQGMVYFLSPRLANKIYELSFTTPYMFTDDVYVGIVADRVENITRYNLESFYSPFSCSKTKQQEQWRSRSRGPVFYHTHSHNQMYTLWQIYCHYGNYTCD